MGKPGTTHPHHQYLPTRAGMSARVRKVQRQEGTEALKTCYEDNLQARHILSSLHRRPPFALLCLSLTDSLTLGPRFIA